MMWASLGLHWGEKWEININRKMRNKYKQWNNFSGIGHTPPFQTSAKWLSLVSLLSLLYSNKQKNMPLVWSPPQQSMVLSGAAFCIRVSLSELDSPWECSTHSNMKINGSQGEDVSIIRSSPSITFTQNDSTYKQSYGIWNSALFIGLSCIQILLSLP